MSMERTDYDQCDSDIMRFVAEMGDDAMRSARRLRKDVKEALAEFSARLDAIEEQVAALGRL